MPWRNKGKILPNNSWININDKGMISALNITTKDEFWFVIMTLKTGDAPWNFVIASPHRPRKSKTVHSPQATERYVCIFLWDESDIIHNVFLSKGTTIISRPKVNLTNIKRCLRWMKPTRQSCVWNHDNARPHVDQEMMETVRMLNFAIVSHPPHTGWLSFFGLFVHPKTERVKDKSFSSNEDV